MDHISLFLIFVFISLFCALGRKSLLLAALNCAFSLPVPDHEPNGGSRQAEDEQEAGKERQVTRKHLRLIEISSCIDLECFLTISLSVGRVPAR